MWRAGLLFCLAVAIAGPAWAGKLADASYPEGALWLRGKLYYAEMGRDALVVSDLAATRTLWRRKGCGPVSVAPYGAGLIVLCHLAHDMVRISRAGETVEVVKTDSAGYRFLYPNASASDGEGVYFSSSGHFDLEAPATGAVLYLDGAGKLVRVAEGIRYANGVAFDGARRRLFVSAHLARQVLVFAVTARGTLGESRVFFDLDAAAPRAADMYRLAGPDGLELDEDGNLFVAEYGAGRVHKVAPDGRWLGMQEGFARFVTDLALLPGDRAAVTASRINNAPPFPGTVEIRECFSEGFAK